MRQRFVCVKCGLRTEGRVGKDGRVYVYDKAGSDPDSTPRQCICLTCSTRPPESR